MDNSTETFEFYAGLIAEKAMRIAGASRAVAVVARNDEWSEAATAQVDLFKRETLCNCELSPSNDEFREVVSGDVQPRKLPCELVNSQTFDAEAGDVCKNFPSNSGSLAVPLIDSVGESLGLVQVLESLDGDFSPTTESAILHFSVLASKLIESVSTCRTHEGAIERLAERIENLEFDHRLLRILHQAESRFIADEAREIVFAQLLEEVLQLTSSQIGLIAEAVSVDGTVALQTCAIHGEFPDQWVDGFYRDVLKDLPPAELDGGRHFRPTETPTQRQHTIRFDENEPERFFGRGLRQRIRSWVVLPLYQETRLVGLFAFSCQQESLDGRMRSQLEPLLSTCAGLIVAGTIKQERVEIQAELEKANRQLARQAIRLKAVNEELESFSYSVSHDLRAPLRGIDTFGQFLLEDYRHLLDPEGQRFLEIIREESQRMGKLIENLLRLSRTGRQKLRPDTVSMRNLALQAFESIPPDLKGHVQQFKIGPLPEGYGESGLLLQVFHNLLTNAFKFTASKANAEVEVGGFVEENRCVYFVRDNGVGFDPRFKHKMFQVFQRLHSEKEFEGTGVGLAIVHRIVTRHGGDTWAEGEPGRGSIVFFSLPRIDSPSSSTPRPVQEDPQT